MTPGTVSGETGIRPASASAALTHDVLHLSAAAHHYVGPSSLDRALSPGTAPPPVEEREFTDTTDNSLVVLAGSVRALSEVIRGPRSVEGGRWLVAAVKTVADAAYLAAESPLARETAADWDAGVHFDQLAAVCTPQRRQELDEQADRLSGTHEVTLEEVEAVLDRCGAAGQPITRAAAALLRRIEGSQSEHQVAAVKAVARRTSGMRLNVSEEDEFGLVQQETVYGPERGQEETLGVGRVPEDLQAVLGVTTNQAYAEVQTVGWEQVRRLLKQARLPDSADGELVRLTVVSDALARAARDNQITEVLDNLTSLEEVQPGHLAQVRANLYVALSRVASEGATYSRAKLGDEEAQSYLNSVLNTLSQLTRAPVHYLQAVELATVPVVDWELPLPAPDLLVFHDRPLPVPGTPLKVLGWLFTGRDGDLHPYQVPTAFAVPAEEPSTFRIHLVSLTGGAAAALDGQVLHHLTRSSWTVATRRIGDKPGSRPWRDKLGRGSRREIREGGLLGVRHLAGPTSSRSAIGSQP